MTSSTEISFRFSFPRLQSDAHECISDLRIMWNTYLRCNNTNIPDFLRMISSIIAELTPDQLTALLVNCSLLTKVRKVLKHREIWGKHFYVQAAMYLLGSFSMKKPLIIGFIAFEQLCQLRRRNRHPSEDFTAENIEFVENLKKGLDETIFHADVMTEIAKRRSIRQGDMSQWDIPDYMNRFGWFIFAVDNKSIGNFDPLPYKSITTRNQG
jgi:hypothetical protein